MLGAFYEFAPFINGATQFINPSIAQQFINRAEIFRHAQRSLNTFLHVHGDEMSKVAHRKLFEDYCKDCYLDKAGTSGNKSKTICREKAEKIKAALQENVPDNCTPSFVFWVKKTKKFQLLSYEELDLKDVLCLPAKVKVSRFNDVINYFVLTAWCCFLSE